MNRRKIIMFGFIQIFLCLLTGCQEEASLQKSPPTVLFEPLIQQKVEISRELPGRVAAQRMAEVRPQAGGILRERLFEEGDEVLKGQVLYRIDEAPFRAAYNEARAALEKARSRESAARNHMERCVFLAKKHAVPLQERDDAIAAYREVEAEIATARELLEKASIELGYTNIKAPISGKIGRSLVREGTLLSKNQSEPMAVINQLDPVYVDVSLPAVEMIALKNERAAGKDGNRQFAEVSIDESAKTSPILHTPYKCEILFSETEANEATGTVVTRLKCDNAEKLLLPGMYVKTRLPVKTMEHAILIPQRSVGRDNRNRPIVYVLKHEKEEFYRLEERPVKLLMEYDGKWVIGDGLESGELLLVEGLQNARNGAIVKGNAKNGQER